MNYRTKINLIILLLQISFVVLYTIVFTNDVAAFVAGWGDYKLNISIIFGISMLFYLSLHLIMNKTDKFDERNKKNEAKSAAATLVTMLFLTPISLMVLYVVNAAEGSIPLYSLWYFAFIYFSGTIVVFTISNLIIPLIGTKYED